MNPQTGYDSEIVRLLVCFAIILAGYFAGSFLIRSSPGLTALCERLRGVRPHRRVQLGCIAVCVVMGVLLTLLTRMPPMWGLAPPSGWCMPSIGGQADDFSSRKG